MPRAILFLGKLGGVDLNPMQTISRSLSRLFISAALVKAAYLSASVSALPARSMMRPREINQPKTGLFARPYDVLFLHKGALFFGGDDTYVDV